MAYNRINFNYANGIENYIADFINDLNYLPYTAALGSSCLVLEDENTYIKNSSGIWKKIGENKNYNDEEQSVTFRTEIVDTLPSIGESNLIYLVPSSDTTENNIYNEFLYVNNHWEQIGAREFELNPINNSIIDSYFNN